MVFKLRKKVLVKGSKMIIIIVWMIFLKWVFRIEDLCFVKDDNLISWLSLL